MVVIASWLIASSSRSGESGIGLLQRWMLLARACCKALFTFKPSQNVGHYESPGVGRSENLGFSPSRTRGAQGSDRFFCLFVRPLAPKITLNSQNPHLNRCRLSAE